VGQWLAGDAHVAPAAQLDDVRNVNAPDLNIPAEDDNINLVGMDLN
jgi:hypothetical protein